MANPTWDDTEEIAGGTPSWDDTEEVVDTRIDMDAQQPREMAPWESATQGFRDVSTFGFGNELSAAAGTAWEKMKSPQNGMDFPWGDTYDAELAAQEGANVQAQAQNPDAYTTGQVAGTAASMVVPGGAITKGAKKVGDAVVKTAISKPAEWAAKKAAGTKLGETVVKEVGRKINRPIADAVKHQGYLGERTATIGATSAVRAAVPQTAMEAVGALIGHTILPCAGAPLGTQAVRQTANAAVGTKGLMGRQGTAFAKKYGDWVSELTTRGGDALTANVFVRQSQDPEFREMLKAAKAEATKE